LSPNDDLDGQRARCEWYLQNGGEVAVLIDPERGSATRFTRDGREETLSEPGRLVLLPGLELALSEIFAVLER
jgi:Uma2 family endonuclease